MIVTTMTDWGKGGAGLQGKLDRFVVLITVCVVLRHNALTPCKASGKMALKYNEGSSRILPFLDINRGEAS